MSENIKICAAHTIAHHQGSAASLAEDRLHMCIAVYALLMLLLFRLLEYPRPHNSFPVGNISPQMGHS
jgi:hypothetical protein